MELVEYKDDFESNITVCVGCEHIVLFSDLWDKSYCCKGCRLS